MSWLYDAVSSVSDAVSSAVGTVTDSVHSTVTAAGRAVGGLKYTVPLGDKELTRLLVACAANVYQHSGAEGGPTKYLGSSLECTKRASMGSGLDRSGLDYVSYGAV
ncbi:hypothetical protein HXX76_014801 [Chlamydomonas incerta]|uniref:Uncharacterized protein n=1 Tax=Chlamydomonas incerta TaxID=51695 RepID=A0A835SG06_CHLIN|nr:hypothetical protein HXX76_014801 [Chlamydomonas incerta]|eukprot:KAG2424127.1 hypothetical protein HXX76_014801 [Chlamydomonas incerta]